jgi:Fe2+ or Zn2+ uptake regulation protein
MINQDILKQLKSQGTKLTEARSLLIRIFEKHALPQTEMELREKLAKAGIVVNKTTVYRELAYLKDKKIIHQIDFGDDKKRYELKTHNHHHHIVCTNCKQVDEVHIDHDVGEIEKKIRKHKRFIVKSHSLEFFGLCRDCAK